MVPGDDLSCCGGRRTEGWVDKNEGRLEWEAGDF